MRKQSFKSVKSPKYRFLRESLIALQSLNKAANLNEAIHSVEIDEGDLEDLELAQTAFPDYNFVEAAETGGGFDRELRAKTADGKSYIITASACFDGDRYICTEVELFEDD